jgi:hypothetical protein
MYISSRDDSLKNFTFRKNYKELQGLWNLSMGSRILKKLNSDLSKNLKNSDQGI